MQCATCKTSGNVVTHRYEQVCTKCGLVVESDYMDRSPLDDYNHVTQQMYTDTATHADVSTSLANIIWPHCPESVTETANHLFSDFCKKNGNFKGAKRESAIYASIFHSQNIMNIGVRSKQWFDDKMIDKSQFTQLAADFAKFIDADPRWRRLLDRKRHTLDDHILEILSEFEIPEQHRPMVRRRAYILQSKLNSTSNRTVIQDISGVKPKNLHTAFVYIAAKSIKIAPQPIKSVSLCTIRKIVEILSKL